MYLKFNIDELFISKLDGNMEIQSKEITSENKDDDQKRQQFTDSAFGPNPQPVLQRVEFKVCIQTQPDSDT